MRQKESPGARRDTCDRRDHGDAERRADENPVARNDRAWAREGPAPRVGEAAAVHRDCQARRAPDRRDEQRARQREETEHARGWPARVVDAPRATGKRDRLPFIGEERYEPERGERTDGEAPRRVKVLDERVRELGRIDARDRDDAGERDAHETDRDRHTGRDAAADHGVEEADADRGDEDGRGSPKQCARRNPDRGDGDEDTDEHERGRHGIDGDEEREHEDERRADLRERMCLRERRARVRGERLEEAHAARPPASRRRLSANASTKSASWLANAIAPPWSRYSDRRRRSSPNVRRS